MKLYTAPLALTVLLGIAACERPAPTPHANETGIAASPATLARTAALPAQSDDSYYMAAADAVAARAETRGVRPAKNVILLIGDGMGISTVTAGRIYAGQKKGLDGESYRLAMETLPSMALSKTYSHDSQVSDSASTATAMVAGIKANSRTLGVRKEVGFGNCAAQAGNGTDSLFELAERQGLATGIISTARVTHATPASTYSESSNRNWEADSDIGANAGDCRDIARQMIEWPDGDGFEIVLGGGRRAFMPDSVTDPEDENRKGDRADGRDLTAEWTAKSNNHVYVTSLNGFRDADIASGARMLGLFEHSHMEYEMDRLEDTSLEPSIAEMTRTAITRLSQDEDGYVLMIEGGRIDHAHHGVNAARALEDTVAFDDAVAAALEMTDPEDTLVIVTADHSHTMTIAGYPQRNNPILGKTIYPVSNDMARGEDGLPYTTLSYANGQSACRPVDGKVVCTREDLSEVDTTAPDFNQPSLVPMRSETHAGEDVAIFARGPGSELVSGVMEQNEIFHVMGKATGLVAPSE